MCAETCKEALDSVNKDLDLGSKKYEDSKDVTDKCKPAQVKLTVKKAGSGKGTITSVPANINCCTSCSGSFPSGKDITLTAQPATGSEFIVWSGGGCSGNGTCVTTLKADTTITAGFGVKK